MSQTVIQFHALNKEIVSFLKEVVEKNNLRAFGVTRFPQYTAQEIFLFENEKYEKYDLIIVCRSKIEITNKKLYNEYLSKQCGDLMIELGRDDGIDILWKKIIAQFRKLLLKGAYVATPSGYQQYYPKHWYTVGAKMAYERGTIINL